MHELLALHVLVFSNKQPPVNIGIKHVFPCINIRWVPMEVFNIFQGTQQMLMHGKNMFNRYYCINVSINSILGRYFYGLFWHHFFIFFHRRTEMISIDILIPGPCDITSHQKQLLNYGEKWKEIKFITWSAILQKVVVVCHLF